MITYYVSNTVNVMSVHPNDPEWYRIVEVLGISPKVEAIFVTIVREPLTEEKLYAKINEAQHELQDVRSQDDLPF